MTTYLEISAIQVLPPSNVNRDDTGAPKTAMYGGVQRARVSSQSWKRAMRSDFTQRLDPSQVGRRSKQVVQLVMDSLQSHHDVDAAQAEALAVWALETAKLNPSKPKGKRTDVPAVAQMGYLLFLSQQQIDAVARAIGEVLDEGVDPADEKATKAALTAKKVRDLLDTKHSVDIALFGRMVADAPDLNVDAACQVAHALGVSQVVPEFDYFTAVDDVVEDKEESGAGMIGTVEFYSSTVYRYAALNLDQLARNLGDETATTMAVETFVRSFVEAVPGGKQNTFAHQTRPVVVLVSVGAGQPASLVGAFEEAVGDGESHVAQAVARLATHAEEVYSTWRRPETVLVCGLPSQLGALAGLGETVSYDELAARAAAAGVSA